MWIRLGRLYPAFSDPFENLTKYLALSPRSRQMKLHDIRATFQFIMIQGSAQRSAMDALPAPTVGCTAKHFSPPRYSSKPLLGGASTSARFLPFPLQAVSRGVVLW